MMAYSSKTPRERAMIKDKLIFDEDELFRKALQDGVSLISLLCGFTLCSITNPTTTVLTHNLYISEVPLLGFDSKRSGQCTLPLPGATWFKTWGDNLRTSEGTPRITGSEGFLWSLL